MTASPEPRGFGVNVAVGAFEDFDFGSEPVPPLNGFNTGLPAVGAFGGTLFGGVTMLSGRWPLPGFSRLSAVVGGVADGTLGGTLFGCAAILSGRWPLPGLSCLSAVPGGVACGSAFAGTDFKSAAATACAGAVSGVSPFDCWRNS